MRNPWKVNAGTAVFAAAVTGLDAALGHWWWASAPAAAAVINTGLARVHYVRTAKQEQESHRPDYAKIAQLEIELGIVTPPKPSRVVPRRQPMDMTPGLPAAPVYRPRTYCRSCLVWDDEPHAAWCSKAPRPEAQPVRKPDHPCALCIPGRPATNCPFNSVCQT